MYMRDFKPMHLEPIRLSDTRKGTDGGYFIGLCSAGISFGKRFTDEVIRKGGYIRTRVFLHVDKNALVIELFTLPEKSGQRQIRFTKNGTSGAVINISTLYCDNDLDKEKLKGRYHPKEIEHYTDGKLYVIELPNGKRQP